MRRGTLILLFWDYVAGLLGQEGRSKVILNHQNWSWDRSFYRLRHKNWKKLWHRMIQKIWSHKLNKNLFPLWQKDTIENCKMNSQKIFFRCCNCPLEVLCDIFTEKILPIFIYLTQKQLIGLWGIKTSIPSGQNGSTSPARRICIFENNLTLFYFSRLSGQITLLSTRLQPVSLRPKSSQRTLKLRSPLNCLYWT